MDRNFRNSGDTVGSHSYLATMIFDLKSIWFIIFGFQCLLLAVLILLNYRRKPLNYLFALLLIFYFLFLTEYGVFMNLENYNYGIRTFGYRYPLRFLIGPVFYLYISKLIGRPLDGTKYLRWHGIPALISFLSLFIIFIMNREDLINIFLDRNNPDYSSYFALFYYNSILSMLSNTLYLAASFRMLFRYKMHSKIHFSDPQAIEVNALFVFTGVYCIIITIKFFSALIEPLELLIIGKIYYVTQWLFGLSVVLLGIVVLRQKRLASLPITSIPTKTKIDEKSREEMQKGANEIDDIVTSQQLFLNSKLTLQNLAQAVDLPAYKVSQILNQVQKLSFFDYINGLRIKHAKELMRNNRNDDKLFLIATESGFNNTTTFHRVFKRITGYTPAQYMREEGR